jgi:tetratricopeptide (TPR) repeat protein
MGNIRYLQGTFDRAMTHYQLALAAFQRVGLQRGVGEVWHNLAAVHRERNDAGSAFNAALRAIEAAEASGDANLLAQAIAGRAEVWLATGDPVMAHREATRALERHETLADAVRVEEDRRILAVADGALGHHSRAVGTLRLVMERGRTHERPYHVALATRDLAKELRAQGTAGDAKETAHAARVAFERLAASGEVRKLDTFLAECAAFTESPVQHPIHR